MYSSESTATATPPMTGNLPGSDKHCVFRCGRSWFSLPAVSVREITIAPDLVQVPQCGHALAGLCHLRSEFIPVISLSHLLDTNAAAISTSQNTLLVINGSCVWAMAIAEAAALESLETLVTPDVRMDDLQPSPVMGTAMFRDQIVQVLDPNNLFRMAQQSLEGLWQDTTHSVHHANRDQGSQR
ncbi:MAG: chemotaxis protein CheW [Pirellulales bacterium]|nr:chemotaxis protein CheW [Pirellulales bacterium]